MLAAFAATAFTPATHRTAHVRVGARPRHAAPGAAASRLAPTSRGARACRSPSCPPCVVELLARRAAHTRRRCAATRSWPAADRGGRRSDRDLPVLHVPFVPAVHAASRWATRWAGTRCSRDDRRFFFGNVPLQRRQPGSHRRARPAVEHRGRTTARGAGRPEPHHLQRRRLLLHVPRARAGHVLHRDGSRASPTDEGSSLADDVASADWVLLTNFWTGWYEPNASSRVRERRTEPGGGRSASASSATTRTRSCCCTGPLRTGRRGQPRRHRHRSGPTSQPRPRTRRERLTRGHDHPSPSGRSESHVPVRVPAVRPSPTCRSESQRPVRVPAAGPSPRRHPGGTCDSDQHVRLGPTRATRTNTSDSDQHERLGPTRATRTDISDPTELDLRDSMR